MEDNKRLIWADALRGLLILLVVLGHSLQFGDCENRLSWNIINSFHVATFFFISGFINFKEQWLFSSIKKKFLQLGLPFLSWSVLTIIIRGGGFYMFTNAILHPDSTYWFIWILFFVTVLFISLQTLKLGVVSNWILRGKQFSNPNDILLLFMIISLIVIMVITEFRLFGFQFFALYFGFYVYGYWARKFKIRLNKTGTIFMGIGWIILAFYWRCHDVPRPLTNITVIPSSILTYSYRYITALIGALFFVNLAMNTMNKQTIVIKFLCYFGKISLGVYVIHLFISNYISSLYYSLLLSNTSVEFVICDFITKVAISVFFIYLIKKIPIVRLFLLGIK